MGKVLLAVGIVAALIGIYLLGVIITAVATAVGSVIGLLFIVVGVVGWIGFCWSGYRANRKTKKSGVGG